MCGIAGILRVHPPGQAPPPPHISIPEAWLDILDESVKHRGPDGHGRFRDRSVRPDGSIVDVALVHRRLSIIDHAGGHQPMVLRPVDPRATPGADPLSPQSSVLSPEPAAAYRRTAEHTLNPCPRCGALGRGTIAVVFNGCIYNHRDLRKELEATGHVFTTDHSDTEVLVHGWGEWKDGSWARLEGMFSVGVWDRGAGALMLSRDQFGEKPLYGVSCHQGTIEWRFFASNAAGPFGAMRQLGLTEPPTASSNLATWLRFGFSGAIPGPFGFTVQPSRSMDATEPRPGQKAFHRVWPCDRPAPRSRHLNAGEVESLLAAAVSRRLEADVPLACFLSGGVDSSLVALLAHRSLGSLATFSVRMPDPRYDESGFGERVAGLVGSNHTTLECEASPAGELIELITRLGLPFGDSSLLPAHWVSKAARRSVPVALGGDGGDELFAGYDRYAGAAILGRWRAACALVSAIAPAGRDPKSAAARFQRLGDAARHGYPELVSIFGHHDLARLTPNPTADDHPVSDCGPMRDGMEAAIRWDVLNYLPGDLLSKVDTASMHVALEVRSPFLDTDLAGAALGASITDLMPHGQRKGLLRAVARKYFPPEIVDRPKQGFAIPIGEWFRSDYGGMRQLLLDHLNGPEPFGPDHLGINAMINMGFVRQMLREHDDAGSRSIWPWKGRDHSQRLYMMLVLSIWAKWFGSL